MDYRNPVEKRGRYGHSLSEREGQRARGPDPCLGRLLVLFWAHYIEDGPHLLCTGSLWVVTCYRKQGEDVADYIKEEGYLQM